MSYLLTSKRNFEDADHQAFGFWVKLVLIYVSFFAIEKARSI